MIRPQDTTAKPFIKSTLLESGTSIFILFNLIHFPKKVTVLYKMMHIHEAADKLQNKREEVGKGNST